MTDQEFAVYGMSQDDIRKNYMNSVTAQLMGLHKTGMAMVVMSILSDCQEMIASNNPTILHPNVDEYIRKQLNVAKFILSEMMQADKK